MKLNQAIEIENGPYLIGHVTSGDHPIQWELFYCEHGTWENAQDGIVDLEEDYGIDLEDDYVFRLPGTPRGLDAWDNPQFLYRQTDGARFIQNPDGTYSMERSEMHKPHKWSYEILARTDMFKPEPPERIEPTPPPRGGGCGHYDDDGC